MKLFLLFEQERKMWKLQLRSRHLDFLRSGDPFANFDVSQGRGENISGETSRHSKYAGPLKRPLVTGNVPCTLRVQKKSAPSWRSEKQHSHPSYFPQYSLGTENASCYACVALRDLFVTQQFSKHRYLFLSPPLSLRYGATFLRD